MSVTMSHPALLAAERLAPVPEEREAPTVDWVRHYAAQGFAAFAASTEAMRAAGPDLGFLVALAVASTAAAAALRGADSAELWDLTPESGALNGEYLEWLTELLDQLGINPADIDPRYAASDFRSPREKNTQEPCGTCSSTAGGCADCQPEVTRADR